jgi:hypothetical protein
MEGKDNMKENIRDTFRSNKELIAKKKPVFLFFSAGD